ncbi:hypothetical protein N658DRAFT_482056 [Parathielavia hyrcaniae]|uniref:Uncharacterized protein n=1 Tax=Parathielavia hyrcaniae TaxID=113614 RepID=A0AAN6T625_9PEZI|nr:hypothetical protein N658DRAFT_482056 [Parathielavia hyrcaniae]
MATLFRRLFVAPACHAGDGESVSHDNQLHAAAHGVDSGDPNRPSPMAGEARHGVDAIPWKSYGLFPTTMLGPLSQQRTMKGQRHEERRDAILSTPPVVNSLERNPSATSYSPSMD